MSLVVKRHLVVADLKVQLASPTMINNLEHIHINRVDRK